MPSEAAVTRLGLTLAKALDDGLDLPVDVTNRLAFARTRAIERAREFRIGASEGIPRHRSTFTWRSPF